MSDSGRTRSPVAPGDVIAGKYRVERVLGAGGMGAVVAARHLELDQSVALKFILPEALEGKGNLERFTREARAAVKLRSEHVARVYDVGRHGDLPFMVLELLDGTDLAKLNKKSGPLAPADVVEYVVQACEGLVEAHALGIVHRDLKPHNLFLTTRLNGTPLVKVLDFGISKAVGPAAAGQLQLTDSAAVIGSPVYMAPEQMRSARSADVRTDVWAVGVVLYELLSGKLPFDGETVTEVCIRVVNEAPEDLGHLRAGLDPRLVATVMRCLEKEPAARFQSIAELGAALEPFSKSAGHGAAPRVWRAVSSPAGVADGGVNVRAAARAMADETGPATAITFDETERDLSRPPVGPELVGTRANWAEATGSATGSGKPPRSFFAGIAAGVVASIGAGIIVAGIVWTHGRDGAPVAATPPPPATPPSALVTQSPSAPPAPPGAARTREPAPADPPAASASAAPEPPRAGRRPARVPSPPGASPASGEPARAAPSSTATTSPAPANGAPILR